MNYILGFSEFICKFCKKINEKTIPIRTDIKIKLIQEIDDFMYRKKCVRNISIITSILLYCMTGLLLMYEIFTKLNVPIPIIFMMFIPAYGFLFLMVLFPTSLINDHTCKFMCKIPEREIRYSREEKEIDIYFFIAAKALNYISVLSIFIYIIISN